MIADIVVAGVLLISGVLAFSMGLVKFLLLIASWLGAAVAAYLGFQHLGPFFEFVSKEPLFQAIAAAVTLFVLSLIALTITTHMISNHIRGSVLGHLDRALGFVFGLFLGVVLVSMIYVGLTLFWPNEDDMPKQIAEAKTLPLIRVGASTLVSLLPEGAFTRVQPKGDELDDAVGNVEDAVKDMANDKIDKLGDRIDSIDAEDRLNKLMQPEPPAEEPPAESTQKKPGYGADERSDMQRLIENNQ